MPIEFACSSCHLKYSVKDELAGRTAKCGKCGHRMKIPQATAATSAASSAASAKQVAPASKQAAPTSKPTAPAARSTAKPAPKPVAAAVANDAASWLDDELETSQPVIAPSRASGGNSCPSCGKPIDRKAVLCISCGYDTRTGEKRETQHMIESDADAKKSAKESKASAIGSMMLGTLFSFIGAMIGALIWAVIVYLTHYEITYVAIGLGALCGFGMNMGYDPDDGTFAGIISAFMSLVGIVAAKVMTVLIFISAMVGSLGDIEIDEATQLEMMREGVAYAMAEENLVNRGVNLDDVTDEQLEAEKVKVEAELKDLDLAALEKKMAEIEARIDAAEAEEQVASENATPPATPEVAPPEPIAEAPDELADSGEEEGLGNSGFIALFFATMFSPFDAIFILLAFFTAYKVGSGEMTD
jgi:hypothetical protein